MLTPPAISTNSNFSRRRRRDQPRSTATYCGHPERQKGRTPEISWDNKSADEFCHEPCNQVSQSSLMQQSSILRDATQPPENGSNHRLCRNFGRLNVQNKMLEALSQLEDGPHHPLIPSRSLPLCQICQWTKESSRFGSWLCRRMGSLPPTYR